MKLMVKDANYKPISITLLTIFIVTAVLGLVLAATEHLEDKLIYLFGGTYGLTALVGGTYGLFAARNWGYFKSYFGKAIIFLSFGLLLQEFGQLAFTYLFVIAGIEVPYPSVADIGFFGAVPMYIVGAFCLMRGLSVGTIIKKSPIKVVVGVLVPLVVLGVCYWAFLKGYDASGMPRLTVFLDLGYPLGQAIYVSIALVTLLAVGKMLGGFMRAPIFLLLSAFILQYAADFNFLFQSHRGTWINGGYGDYLYLIAYFLMSASIIFLTRTLASGFTKSSPGMGD